MGAHPSRADAVSPCAPACVAYPLTTRDELHCTDSPSKSQHNSFAIAPRIHEAAPVFRLIGHCCFFAPELLLLASLLLGYKRHVRLAYQPPASSTFLSEQTSHQQPASSTILSEQISTSHQPTEQNLFVAPLITDITKQKA
jgi:hypothetical protein